MQAGRHSAHIPEVRPGLGLRVDVSVGLAVAIGEEISELAGVPANGGNVTHHTGSNKKTSETLLINWYMWQS